MHKSELFIIIVSFVAAVSWCFLSGAQGGPGSGVHTCHTSPGCIDTCEHDFCCCCPIGPIPPGGSQPPRSCI